MKTVLVKSDLNVDDLSDEAEVQVILNKVDIGEDSNVFLDLSGCLIDYPATSCLIDSVLKQLSALQGQKVLRICTDYILPMSTIINWLFLGSNVVDLANANGIQYSEIVQKISNGLHKCNVSVVIEIKGPSGNVINEQQIN